MQPLTHQVWEKHYPQLRHAVLEEWPQVDRLELEALNEDWNGLVALVSRATGMSPDLTVQSLRKLDVSELGIGAGGDDGAQQDEGRASLRQLQLGAGFSADERARVVDRLSKLNRRLKRFPADGTQLHLSVKERDTPAQSVTLECRVPRFAPFVATSRESDLRAALMDVREDLWRQIDDAVTKRREGAR